ncbi:MAG: rhodanese-like domain-containing protein [Flavobacteriales bacterium]
MGLFSSIFGRSADFAQLVNEGAIILDVRTPGEYAGGQIKGSKNIPLQSIQQNLSKIPKDKVIITCSASGMRSGSAKSILLSNGFKEVHNGGGWMSLKGKI